MTLLCRKRKGYALLLVLAFVLLFAAVLAVAYSQIESTLRIDTVRTQQSRRDEGSVNAIARGLALLETGTPPSDPYSCEVTITTSTGARDYLVTFTSSGTNSWTVQAAPLAAGQSADAMPSTFFSDSIP
jgi:hypothetical protein